MPARTEGDGKRVVVGQFAGPHGVKGEFKLRSFTDDPAAVARYGPLRTQDDRPLSVRLLREAKPGLFVARAKEVTTREECHAYAGALLTVDRDRLPPPGEEEFYLEDLVGLEARTAEGAPAGRVKAVADHGAGDVVELEAVPGRSGVLVLPFTKEDVPEIDVADGTITVVLPPEEDEKGPEG